MKNFIAEGVVTLDQVVQNCSDLSSGLQLLTVLIRKGRIDKVQTACSNFNRIFTLQGVSSSTIRVGDTVEVRYQGRDSWFTGSVVSKEPDGTFGIVYDNGEKETLVRENMIRPFSWSMAKHLVNPVTYFLCDIAASISDQNVRTSDEHIILFVNAIEFLLALVENLGGTAENYIRCHFLEEFVNYSGRQLFTGVLMNITEIIRSDFVGPVTVSISKLLVCLSEMLSSENLYETQIKDIFRDLDLNGDGHISSEELRLGLRRAGYDLPDHTIDALHRQLDTRGDGFIEYPDLVNFATSGDLENIDENKRTKETLMNAVDRTMYELRIQLSECFIPGGKSTFECSKRFSYSVVDVVFKMLTSFGLKKFDSVEVKHFVTKNLLGALQHFLGNVQLVDNPYSLCLHVCSHIVQRIHDDGKYGQLLIQNAVIFGLVAHSSKGHVVGDHFGLLMSTAGGSRILTGLHDQSGKKGLANLSPDQVLPVNFSVIFDSLVETAYHGTVELSLSIFNDLIDFTGHHRKEFLPMILGILGEAAELPIGSVLLTKNLSGVFPCCTSIPHRLEGTFFTFLVSQLTFLRDWGVQPQPSVVVKTASLLSTILNSLGEINRDSRSQIFSVTVDIGLANLPQLAIALCSHLSDWNSRLRLDSRLPWVAGIQSDVCDIFCSLAAYHPELLGFLITGVDKGSSSLYFII